MTPMYIRNLHPTSTASQNAETPAARHGDAPSEDAHRPRLRIVRDRVVISIRARELLDEMRQTPDVETSIRSMLGAGALEDRRADEVRERIQHGYYHQPGVIKEVATVVSGALDSEP